MARYTVSLLQFMKPLAHVEALSWPPCVDWSQWRAAGSRRMYSSSLSHTGGTCTKRRCARTPCTHSFLTRTRRYTGGCNFVPRSTPCDNLTRVKSFTSLMVNYTAHANWVDVRAEERHYYSTAHMRVIKSWVASSTSIGLLRILCLFLTVT